MNVTTAKLILKSEDGERQQILENHMTLPTNVFLVNVVKNLYYMNTIQVRMTGSECQKFHEFYLL